MTQTFLGSLSRQIPVLSNMWAAANAEPKEDEENPWIDRNFAKIAFTVSTLALLILSPLYLFLGTAAGFALHYSIEPNLILNLDDRLITNQDAVFAIVGAFAAFVKRTPSGAVAGFVFQAIPLVMSLGIGSVAYRASRKFF